MRRRVPHAKVRPRFVLPGAGVLLCVILQIYHFHDVVTTLQDPPVRDEPELPSVGVSMSSDSRRVAILGGAGNVGSQLTFHLHEAGYEVVAFDKDPLLPSFSAFKKHSRSLGSDELSKFDTVIFLGGCTAREKCEALSPEQVYTENVENVVNVVRQMTREQHFLTVSSSSVAEGIHQMTEDDPAHTNLLDAYGASMYRREQELRKLAGPAAPQITVFRMSTVIGLSNAQRTDLLVPSLFKAAYTRGVLRVVGGNKMRSFLWMQDLKRAFQAVLDSPLRADKSFTLWNLASFETTIMQVATTVASMTGARIDCDETSNDPKGFSLIATKFEMDFGFTFHGNVANVLQEMDMHVPDSITAKGPHATSEDERDTIPCPVCGSTDQQMVLDLGDQPLANDFRKEKANALASPRFPLKLVRCKVCNHFHLNNVADRGDLFDEYLYQAGTSRTLQQYFGWLAEKIDRETGHPGVKGAVLEIACNDGSQLDHFKKMNWATYGVDPAANLVPLAKEKGHNVKVGFWGQKVDFPELPKGDDLTAIVAQNVFAHVPDPVGFLKAFVPIMGPRTKLYIQTSQCNMHQLGQFDTAYHEHISFFTGHSFHKAATLAGLYITAFEETRVHGTSCLVTMELPLAWKEDKISESLGERLESEHIDGITTDFFYTKYAARAHFTRDWLLAQTRELNRNGYTIGAYGAAAKGMVFLHFMLQESKGDVPLDFVLDDAPLKQGTFCPGTSLPVFATKHVGDVDPSKPLALIVFAWNFWTEIKENLRSELRGKWRDIRVLLPFPTPKLVKLYIEEEETTPSSKTEMLRAMPYFPTPIPNPLQSGNRRKALLVSHFSNEEMLLPYFILNHAPMFDRAILIDYNSTDRSREIIEKNAPPSWKIVESVTGGVLKSEVQGMQIMEIENSHPNDWALALTTTEFLIQSQFRETLMEMEPNSTDQGLIFKFPSVTMVGDDTVPLQPWKSLPEQRHVFAKAGMAYNRVLHIGTSKTHKYNDGRHHLLGPGERPWWPKDGFLMKWQWTPWPESIPRKLNIGPRIPKADRDAGRGFQHYSIHNATELEATRAEALAGRKLFDLCDEHRRFAWCKRAFHAATTGQGCEPK